MKIKGLTDAEVAASKAKYGDNSMTEQPGETFWQKLLGNFGDPMIKILCFALIVNVVLVVLDYAEFYEPVGIAAAILIATLVSTYSEYNNENAFKKLQEEASRIMCKVYRNGEIVEVAINDLVVGDCILLQSGDKIPADGLMIDGDIKVDQSVLNGESQEARKVAIPEGYVEPDEPMDFLNVYKVFRGAVVCSGNGVMRVTVVGDSSVYGKIASELQADDDRQSPLQVKLSALANGISKFGYIGGALIAVAYLFQRFFVMNQFNGAKIGAYFHRTGDVVHDIVNAVMFAVIIIVMAVPEGLPLMVALVSAMNMNKMLKDNVLVRKIVGIETAGSLNILFSDKTGTITKGKLEVVTFINGDLKEFKHISDIPDELGNLITLSIKNNTDSVVSGEGANRKIVGGNATERAVLGFGVGTDKTFRAPKVNSIPFNSTNKYSASTVEGDYNITLIKGAPEKMLKKCKYYYDTDGTRKPLTHAAAIDAKMDELAERAIRVLAFATSDSAIADGSLPEDDWTLVGFVGIRDEVRPESIKAIKEVRRAGVQVVMITGDRKETAVAIAKDAGILRKDTDLVYTSDELAGMTDRQIRKQIRKIRVIARALPSDKSRLVRIAQERNLVVGMTGDGVNDSPALKKADVGFAMGGGTEVAKEAGDIVILDDNFLSIDKAILYGRTIFNSIRKFIVFQLTINVAAVLISFICPLLQLDNPLSVTQILWVNLVMDTLAALAFGGEPALRRFMKEKPKKRDESIISGTMWSSILTGAGYTVIMSLILLLMGDRWFPEWARTPEGMLSENHLTGYFAFFIFAAVFNAFNARTEELNLFDNIGRNKNFLKIMALITVVQVALTYFGGEVFRCHGMTVPQWGIVLLLAFTIIPVDLIRKCILKLAAPEAEKKSVKR
ncbi:MAG: calcium-translocating P-type ATPase, PMCA-type [Clostridia bacterium]|nr:calcium-translocating P-type ATPase, PMCA-type [Clostridia bacterium]